MKSLKLLIIGFLFLGLFGWYIKAVQKKSDLTNNGVTIPFKIMVDKTERKCLLSSSVKKLDGKNAPVVIFLHGMDGAWPNHNFTGPQYDYYNKLAWEKDFIGVFPRGTEGACSNINERSMFYYCWSLKDDRDKKFITKLREAIISQYKADPKKVFLIGFSNGGYFVADYLFKKPTSEFSGYGIHSAGSLITEKDAVKDNPPVKLPVSLNVGLKDPYQLEEMRNLKATLQKLGWEQGKDLNYREYMGSHEMSRDTMKNELEFFLKKN